MAATGHGSERRSGVHQSRPVSARPTAARRFGARSDAGAAEHCRPPTVSHQPALRAPWLLTPEQCDGMRAVLAGQGLGTEQPRPEAPWAFRIPPEEAYPIAEALARWFIDNGRVDMAFLYTVERGYGRTGETLVLGLNERADPD